MERVHKPTRVATPGPTPSFPSPSNDWCGKSGTRERRQIQNRLNQRAYRQRQRTYNGVRAPRETGSIISARNANVQGAKDRKDVDLPPVLSRRTESAPESRSLGSKTPPFGVSAIAAAKPADVDQPHFLSGRSKSAPAAGNPPSSGLVMDELSLLIQRNVMEGASVNAQHLGINPDNLLEGGHGSVLSRHGLTISDPLKPGKLQGEIQHDPIIDILPYPRLRHQLVRALAAGQLDEESFCAEVRESGALDIEGRRHGLLCWGAPDDVGGWEMSEHFARRWCFVLQGCGRLFESTNLWRSTRSEKAIGLSL